MSAPHYLPRREAELFTWSGNFRSRIQSSPEAFGLSPAQASAYGVLHDAFAAAFEVASSNATNSTSAKITKNSAESALRRDARVLSRIIHATPTVTNTQRAMLGLTPRDETATRISAPASAPHITIIATFANTVRIRLHDPTQPSRRGRPSGVDGAAVFSFVGEAPPADELGWKLESLITRNSLDVTFPPGTPPGAKVWFTAWWFNEKKQRGPAAAPAAIHIPGGAAMAA